MAEITHAPLPDLGGTPTDLEIAALDQLTACGIVRLRRGTFQHDLICAMARDGLASIDMDGPNNTTTASATRAGRLILAAHASGAFDR